MREWLMQSRLIQPNNESQPPSMRRNGTLSRSSKKGFGGKGHVIIQVFDWSMVLLMGFCFRYLDNLGGAHNQFTWVGCFTPIYPSHNKGMHLSRMHSRSSPLLDKSPWYWGRAINEVGDDVFPKWGPESLEEFNWGRMPSSFEQKPCR